MELRICVSEPELLQEMEPMMPPGWRRRRPSSVQHTLGLIAEGGDIYSVYNDGVCIHDAPGRAYALTMMDAQIQGRVALKAPDFIFLHAGVVADGGRAIVTPGLSFAGKTTLVRALVDAGALYYSDEYAVLDEAGLVHPYPKALSLRTPEGRASAETPIEELGGRAGVHPLPIGRVVIARYRPDVEWRPRRLTKGPAALALLEHAVPAQERPEQTLRYVRRAVEHVVVLEGERGEADELAHILLDTMRAAA